MAQSPITQLYRAYKVDEAINTNEKHLVIIRFDNDLQAKNEESSRGYPTIEETDEWLKYVANNHGIDVRAYTVKMSHVPELVARYKLFGGYTFILFANNVQVDRLYWDHIDEKMFKDAVQKAIQEMKTENTPKEYIKISPPGANKSSADTRRTSNARRAIFRRWMGYN